MSFEQPTMAEVLRKANYTTQAVGKWHLGYSKWKMTPTKRGFDYHKGYFQGEIDYYQKNFTVPKKFLPWPPITGLDWFENGEKHFGFFIYVVSRVSAENVVRNESGIYNKEIYDKTAARIIQDFDPNAGKPLFFYYAHQLAHVPLDNPPPGEWWCAP